MRIDEIQSQQAVQESKQSKGPQSGISDDAFALLLQSEIAGPGEETAPGAAVCAPISVPGLGIQSLSGNSAQSPRCPRRFLPSMASSHNSTLCKMRCRQTKTPKEINALIEQLNAQNCRYGR